MASGSSSLKELKKEIVQLLEDVKSHEIPVCTFWNSFRNEYDYLPDPEDFGCAKGSKRSTFFDKFNDVVTVIGRGNDRTVKLKPQVNTKKNISKGNKDASKTQPKKVADTLTSSIAGTRPKSTPQTKVQTKKSAVVIQIEDSSSEEDTEGLPTEIMPGNRHHPYAKPSQNSATSNRRDEPKYDRNHSGSKGPQHAQSAWAESAENQRQLINYGQNQQHQQFAPMFGGASEFPQLAESVNYPTSYRDQKSGGRNNQQPYPSQGYTYGNNYNQAGGSSRGGNNSRDNRQYTNQDGRRYGQHTHAQYGPQASQSIVKPSVQVTKDQLNDVAEDSIDRLVDAKEYVSAEKIEKLMLQYYGIVSLQEIQDIRRHEDIPVINSHIRKQCKANAYIQAFARVRPIATLHELGESLKEFVPDTPIQDFEELKLGPLQKQPLVYQFFKFPPESDIPDIDTNDVIEMLKDYLTVKNKWSSRDLDMQEFMLHIKETRSLENPYEAGVKIKSLALAIQVIKRAQRECGQTVRQVVTQQKEILQDDIMGTFRHFSSSVLTKQVGYCEVKKEYLTMNALEVRNLEDLRTYCAMLVPAFTQHLCLKKLHWLPIEVHIKIKVILEVCGRLQLFLEKIQEYFTPTRAERKLVQHLATLRNQLMLTCSTNKNTEAIVRLAICCSQEEIHQQLWGIVEKTLAHWEVKEREVIVLDDDDEDNETEVRGQRSQKPKPALADVSTKVRKYLDRCLAQGALTLSLLSKVESKVCEDYDFPHFRALGQGSFLDILAQGELKKYLDDCGGSTLGGVQKGTGTPESLYHPTQHDVMDFVKQCGIADASQLSYLESALCSHYQVKEVKSLGLGTAKHLMDGQSRGGQRNKEPSVFYEAALCAKDKVLTSSGDRKVGILGHQTKETALTCLQNCPLLEDLSEWSHWGLVFQPELGSLKEFIQKYGRVHNITVTDKGQKYGMTTHILAMETKPGLLIKLTSDSSDEKFAQAADLADTENTCGHLLSLLATNKGLETLPTALLGNHMKTALIKIQASSGVDHVPGGPISQKQSNKVCEFVVECLTLLPFLVCQALASKIFLEPLASVIGKAKSKDQLLLAATTTGQKSRLQILGCALGVSEWSVSFEERKHWPKDCLQRVETVDDGMGGVIESTLDSESEESEDEVDETGTISLSDDDDEEFSDAIEGINVIDVDAVVSDDTEDGHIPAVGMEVEKQAGVVNVDTRSIQETGARMGPCRAVVEQIRREEFGVAVVLSDDGQRLMVKQQERLGRSLDRLSKDLYSKDTHFVLELIQNADDNDYPNEIISQGFDVYPSVEFVVEENKITVLNNECGFLEKNVKALCDVGRSTKGKHKFGYIGQKGIGFKSVFRVTDRPEIHSKGYHICFDVHSGPMGYILPHWIGKLRKVKVKVTRRKEKKTESDKDVLPQESTYGHDDMKQEQNKDTEPDAVIELEDETENVQPEDMESDGEKPTKSEAAAGEAIETVDQDHSEMVEEVDEEVVEEEIEEEVEEEYAQDWTTRIVLPLKDEVKSQNQTLSLAARFHDVHPSLLLFLHRLRRLHIVNKVEEYDLDITRRDLANNIVEIQYKETVDRWLVVKKTLDASKISKQAKSGVEVESTEIALAFQLQTAEERATQILPAKQPVFAFLPLRSYGFRFVIQGDFDVPSSREDVDRDSMWNQWILGEIHKLFVESVQTFKDQPGLTEVEAVCSFLQFVPMEDEILDFFRPVASRIMQQLRAKPCLPTQPTKGKAIQWKMPSQVVINKDPLVSEVVTSELLQKHLNLDYLHRGVVEALNPSLMASLGVQTLTTQHLMDIGRVLVDKLNAMDTDILAIDRQSDIQTLSKWLTCIYRSMDEFQQNEDLLAQLQSLPIIPLTDTQMVKLSEKTVFFPLADDRRKKQNKIALLIQTDINTIDKELFLKLDDVSNSQVRRLLEMLGVKTLTPRDVIHHHIMPILKEQSWKTRPRDIVFAYTMYIKQHYQDGTLLSLDELRPYVVVETNQGLKRPIDTPVHFTPAYLNPIDLPLVLPGHNWVLLDAKYLEGFTSKADVQQWHEFFTKLGVLDFLSVKQEQVLMTPKQMEDSPWEKFLEILPPMDKYKILDCECSEFYSLVIDNDHSSTEYRQMKNLFILLDQQYDSYYKQFMVARVMTPEGVPIKEIDSTFAMLLKQVSWLPGAVVQKQEGSSVSSVVGELMEGGDLYIRTPNTEKLLAHHVPYLDVPLSPQSTFCNFLGIRSNVKIDDVQELLIEWCTPEEGATGNTTTKVFSTSMRHIKAVYSYLKDNLQPKKLQDLFQDHPVIFYTPEVPTDSEECVQGLFLSRDKVRWSDPSKLFQKYGSMIQTIEFQRSCRAILCRHYPEADYKDLFVRVALIQKHPEFEEYAKLLIELCAIVPLPHSLLDILKIYEIIGEGYLKVKSAPPSVEKLKLEAIRTLLKDKRIVPVKGNKMTYLEDEPLIADDRVKESQWRGKSGVSFVDIGDKHRNLLDSSVAVDKVMGFLEFLEIPRLSERLEVTPITESYRPCPELQYYVHKVVPYIQQLLYGEHEEIYRQLTQGNIRAKLNTMNFAQVSKLELVHHLKIKSNPDPIIKNEKCRIIKESCDFFVHMNSVQDYQEINEELTQFFCPDNKEVRRVMKYLLRDLKDLLVDTTDELEQFMSRQNLQALPDDEELWEVRGPANWPPRPPTPPPPTPPVYYTNPMMDLMQTEMSMDEGTSVEEPEVTEDTNKSRGLKQWPPPAPNRGPQRVERSTSNEKSAPLWNPPAPADPVNTSSLPSDLRPSKLAPYKSDKKEGEESDGHARPHSPHGDGAQNINSHPTNQQYHRQHSSNVHQDSEGEGHRLKGQGHDGYSGEGYGIDGGKAASEKTTSTEIQEDVPPPDVESYNTSALSDVSVTRETSHGTVTGGATSEMRSQAAEDTEEGEAESRDQQRAGEFSRSQSQIEMEYIGSQGNQETISVDENWVGDGTDMSGGHPMGHGRKPMKRPRTESNNGEDACQGKKPPVIFYGNPVWTETDNETVYEDLTQSSDIKIPENIELESNAAPPEIGRWGESFVNSYLNQLKVKNTETDICEVLWVNEEKESGLPYDFMLKVRDSLTNELQPVYIEVKSTLSDKKAFFEISSQEFKFAQHWHEHFHIYRVFNAGSATSVRLTKLVNLSKLLEKSQVKLCMVV